MACEHDRSLCLFGRVRLVHERKTSILGEAVRSLILEETSVVAGSNCSLKNELTHGCSGEYLKRRWGEVTQLQDLMICNSWLDKAGGNMNEET